MAIVFLFCGSLYRETKYRGARLEPLDPRHLFFALGPVQVSEPNHFPFG